MKELIDESVFIGGLSLAALGLLMAGIVCALVGRLQKKSGVGFAGLAMIIAAPLLWAMWRVYDRVTQHFGLDSVKGLGVNILAFVIIGALVGLILGLVSRRNKKSEEKEAAN